MSVVTSPSTEVVTIKVFMLTYDHEAFIQQAIDSVLMQRTRHRVIMVIGEDRSTDRTREIVQQNAAEHPDKFHLILSEKNKGTSSVGYAVWEECLQGCAMIALLDGDDHWTDPNKLEDQAQLLLDDPEVSLCYTNAYQVYPDGRKVDYLRSWLGNDGIKERCGVGDMIQGNFIPLATMLINNRPQFKLFEMLKDRPVIDLLINLALAQRGPLVCIDRITAVRRVHSGGMISMKGMKHKAKVNLGLLGHVDEMTHGEFRKQVRNRERQVIIDVFDHAVQAKDRATAREFWYKLYRRSNELSMGAGDLFKRFILAFLPQLARLFYAAVSRGDHDQNKRVAP